MSKDSRDRERQVKSKSEAKVERKFSLWDKKIIYKCCQVGESLVVSLEKKIGLYGHG